MGRRGFRSWILERVKSIETMFCEGDRFSEALVGEYVYTY